MGVECDTIRCLRNIEFNLNMYIKPFKAFHGIIAIIKNYLIFYFVPLSFHFVSIGIFLIVNR